MHTLKELIKRLLPGFVLALYHRTLAIVANWLYGHPSKEMIVIGITGTKGKSTTALVLWQLLTAQGHTVGLTSTVYTRIGQEIDDQTTAKMTMAGRFTLQSLLRRMVNAGCDIVIVETTSLGIAQYRHLGIAYDICVFTNLGHDHIEAHGGFENYKHAKLELFHHLDRLPEKILPNGDVAPRASIINMHSEYADEFADVGSYKKILVSGQTTDGTIDVVVSNIQEKLFGTSFELNNAAFQVPLLGAWNAWNVALAATAASEATGNEIAYFSSAASHLEQVPGRMEFIDEGQLFKVIVDYAYEPESLTLLYEFCHRLLPEDAQMLTTISSTGGGRDVRRRKPNGEAAGRYCDYVVVTDEDPYDDDPLEIMRDVEEGVRAAGKIEGESYWMIQDRRGAIAKLFEIAQPGDVVLLVAKGAETKMAVAGGEKIDWDDRVIARELLREMKA